MHIHINISMHIKMHFICTIKPGQFLFIQNAFIDAYFIFRVRLDKNYL